METGGNEVGSFGRCSLAVLLTRMSAGVAVRAKGNAPSYACLRRGLPKANTAKPRAPNPMTPGSGTTWKLASAMMLVAPEATNVSTCVSEKGAGKASGPEPVAVVGKAVVPADAI